MLAKRLISRGSDLILPIVGDVLSSVRLSLDCLPALIFQDEEKNRSELTVEDSIVLGQGDSEQILTGSKPGKTFAPSTLAPLIELLGLQIVDAVAKRNGRLIITFSDQIRLEVTSTTGYEAWHFVYPSQLHHPKQKVRQISLHGAYGRII